MQREESKYEINKKYLYGINIYNKKEELNNFIHENYNI
jgi:hypothetical protein